MRIAARSAKSVVSAEAEVLFKTGADSPAKPIWSKLNLLSIIILNNWAQEGKCVEYITCKYIDRRFGPIILANGLLENCLSAYVAAEPCAESFKYKLCLAKLHLLHSNLLIASYFALFGKIEHLN